MTISEPWHKQFHHGLFGRLLSKQLCNVPEILIVPNSDNFHHD